MDNKILDKFFRDKGYTMQTVNQMSVMAKGFTCVYVGIGYFGIFHNIGKGSLACSIERDFKYLKGILDYMETI